jgi:hypothetical protein
MGVAADDVRDGLPGGAALPADLDAGQVERVEDELNLAQGQGRVNLVGVAVQGDGRGLADGAALAPQERLVQPGGLRERRRGPVPAVCPPLRGCLAGLGVHPAVIDGVCPRGEQPVQLADASHVPPAGLAGIAGDLDEELLPDGEEQALYLPAPLRPARRGAGEPDAEHGAGPQQPRVHERGAVVDVMTNSS